MITNVSEFLKALIDEESQKLDKSTLTHAPTIGGMYEGLTGKILEKAIPPSLNLRIVTGFIFNDLKNRSGQIDCMLVKGEGIPIPYTEKYEYHVNDVLAVFEVKKNLYTKDFEDSFTHLREVRDIFLGQLSVNTSQQKVDLGSVNQTFAQMTGVVPPPYLRASEMKFELQLIYHSLVIEHLAPIRIVLGYHGFRSEFTLRGALMKFLKEHQGKQGFGIGSFPHLITTGKYSLVKFNGEPYCPKMKNGEWDFYGSTNDNPIFLLLELIWTKIEQNFPVGGFWGEDLEVDVFHPFLSGKPIEQNCKWAWGIFTNNLARQDLLDNLGKIPWEPIHIDYYQFTVLNELVKESKVNITDEGLLNWLRKNKQDPKLFVDRLVETGLVGLEGDLLRLTSKRTVCGALPDGQFYATENDSGRLMRWIEKNNLKVGIVLGARHKNDTNILPSNPDQGQV